MSAPLAYHLTWTTYGSWLPGDNRGWVEGGTTGIQDADQERKEQARSLMKEPPVTLTPEQRALVKAIIEKHCAIRGWKLHAINVRSNHVHVVVTADKPPEKVLSEFKLWASRVLSDAEFGTTPGQKDGRMKWWTKHGSTKWINTEEYLDEAVEYVADRQGAG